MRSSTLETIILFQSLADTLEKHLFATEEAYFKDKCLSMTFKDLLRVNEELRRKDCESYRLNIEKQQEPGFIPASVELHNSFRVSVRSSCNPE